MKLATLIRRAKAKGWRTQTWDKGTRAHICRYSPNYHVDIHITAQDGEVLTVRKKTWERADNDEHTDAAGVLDTMIAESWPGPR